jgi:hypothetical protein
MPGSHHSVTSAVGRTPACAAHRAKVKAPTIKTTEPAVGTPAVIVAEHHGSDADRQAITLQFVAGRKILP